MARAADGSRQRIGSAIGVALGRGGLRKRSPRPSVGATRLRDRNQPHLRFSRTQVSTGVGTPQCCGPTHSRRTGRCGRPRSAPAHRVRAADRRGSRDRRRCCLEPQPARLHGPVARTTRPPTSSTAQWNPIRKEGCNEGMQVNWYDLSIELLITYNVAGSIGAVMDGT